MPHDRQPLGHLVVIAKACLPGRVKTRLTPPLTPEEAAAVAAASLSATLDVARRVAVAERILLFDGDPAGLDTTGFHVVPQGTGGLDVRIAEGFDASARGALLIGMDTPQVDAGALQAVIDDRAADAWFGPADDGGFWALGLRAPLGRLVRGVAMSTDRTGRDQLERLRAAGLDPVLLPALRDVDTVDDALAVAAAMPGTRFQVAVERALAAHSVQTAAR